MICHDLSICECYSVGFYFLAAYFFCFRILNIQLSFPFMCVFKWIRERRRFDYTRSYSLPRGLIVGFPSLSFPSSLNRATQTSEFHGFTGTVHENNPTESVLPDCPLTLTSLRLSTVLTRRSWHHWSLRISVRLCVSLDTLGSFGRKLS